MGDNSAGVSDTGAFSMHLNNGHAPAEYHHTGPHRTTCHGCGNVRRHQLQCAKCPTVYCRRCAERAVMEFGVDAFARGCPVCESRCCCARPRAGSSNSPPTATAVCTRLYHCYKRCKHKKDSTKATGPQPADPAGVAALRSIHFDPKKAHIVDHTTAEAIISELITELPSHKSLPGESRVTVTTRARFAFNAANNGASSGMQSPLQAQVADMLAGNPGMLDGGHGGPSMNRGSYSDPIKQNSGGMVPQSRGLAGLINTSSSATPHLDMTTQPGGPQPFYFASPDDAASAGPSARYLMTLPGYSLGPSPRYLPTFPTPFASPMPYFDASIMAQQQAYANMLRAPFSIPSVNPSTGNSSKQSSNVPSGRVNHVGRIMAGLRSEDPRAVPTSAAFSNSLGDSSGGDSSRGGMPAFMSMDVNPSQLTPMMMAAQHFASPMLFPFGLMSGGGGRGTATPGMWAGQKRPSPDAEVLSSSSSSVAPQAKRSRTDPPTSTSNHSNINTNPGTAGSGSSAPAGPSPRTTPTGALSISTDRTAVSAAVSTATAHGSTGAFADPMRQERVHQMESYVLRLLQQSSYLDAASARRVEEFALKLRAYLQEPGGTATTPMHAEILASLRHDGGDSEEEEDGGSGPRSAELHRAELAKDVEALIAALTASKGGANVPSTASGGDVGVKEEGASPAELVDPRVRIIAVDTLQDIRRYI